MTQRRDPWRWVVGAAQQAVGAFPASLAASWCAELDAVENVVDAVENAAPARAGRAPDGALALVCLAAARLGTGWSPAALVEAAAAVELAGRAVRHHADIADRPYVGRVAAVNRQLILDGDWSITRAASLAAGIGPDAYRALVRGYGCVQLAALVGRVVPMTSRSAFGADAGGLAKAAVSMGLIVAGQPAMEAAAPTLRYVDISDGSRDAARVVALVGWVTECGAAGSVPLAVSGVVSAVT